MTDIKTNFHTWLTQSKDNQSKTTPLTANEYINRLNRLSKRLYDKEGLQYMSAFQCMDRKLIVNPSGKPSKAQHENSAFGRNAYTLPTHTITQGSDSLCGDWTLHPGEDLGNGEYSDPRPYSIAEIFALTGLDDNFIKAIPAWARGNDKLLRQLCGEALMPNLLAHCLSSLNK
ncbi:MAG: hypothetical protein IKN67_00130 [Alphaproteobacteria bacterium]|nr:hypothetical protein [Alphaproteobacteria bacterium]